MMTNALNFGKNQMDSLQGFVNAFKQFEKKLDKIQDILNCHGNTLSELQVVVSHLAYNMDKSSRVKALKTAEVQYEQKSLYEPEMKTRRVEAMRPLPKKKVKSLQDRKQGLTTTSVPILPLAPLKKSSPVVDQLQRLRKPEAPRKVSRTHPQKAAEKKKNVVPRK